MALLLFVAAVGRITLPYALAALGGTWSERSGVINITLEGTLLAGAFCTILGAHATGSAPLGVACGALSGALLALFYGLLVLRFSAKQVVCGVAINLLCDGATRFFLKVVFDSASNSPRVPALAGSHLFFVFMIGTVLACLLSHAILYRTPFGLRVRAVGDHPEAAASLGVAPARVRLFALVICGTLAGLGGAWLAVDQKQFVAGMSSGRGYIALAALILGRWRPLWGVLAALLFGVAEAAQVSLSVVGRGLPGWLVQMLPYLVTLSVLALFPTRLSAPRALGRPLR